MYLDRTSNYLTGMRSEFSSFVLFALFVVIQSFLSNVKLRCAVKRHLQCLVVLYFCWPRIHADETRIYQNMKIS